MLLLGIILAAAPGDRTALDRQLARYSCCRDGWVVRELVVARELADGFELRWSVEGDLKDDVFTEHIRVETTRWTSKDVLPDYEFLWSWAYRASTPSKDEVVMASSHIVLRDGTHWRAYEYGSGVEIWRPRGGVEEPCVRLNGRPFARGRLHGVFGPFLVMLGAQDDGDFAEADIYDIRDGSHLRHVRINLMRPLHLRVGDGDDGGVPQQRAYRDDVYAPCSALSDFASEPSSRGRTARAPPWSSR